MSENLHEHQHSEDCGCEQKNEKMTLVLDDDSELLCDVLGIFDVEDHEYIALLPEGDEEVLIYRYVTADNEEGFELRNIESDEEYDKVGDIFFDLFYEDEDLDEELEDELENEE